MNSSPDRSLDPSVLDDMQLRRALGLHRRGGFTLIELLVVVAIVAVLASLLLSAIPKVKLRTQMTRARQDINQIEMAFTAYFTEYKRWPTGIAGYDNTPDNEGNLTGVEMVPGVVKMLAGDDVNSMNPRRIAFLEVRSADTQLTGAFVDPWENPYKYMLDYNQNADLLVNFSNNDWSTNFPNKAVAVWSRGLNASDMKSDGGNKDDVTNW
ncbi:MAG: prepilin-type N-terminal cleavage/methylation domain-containing protein [Kiritimatiellae bacterium]|nr:prepilin-type N-terminal cleavage/methylation domain-containing protein [Kiritimatiellia bacterium]